jgi:hypothetical protein
MHCRFEELNGDRQICKELIASGTPWKVAGSSNTTGRPRRPGSRSLHQDQASLVVTRFTFSKSTHTLTYPSNRLSVPGDRHWLCSQGVDAGARGVPLRLPDGTLVGYMGLATSADQAPLLLFPKNLDDRCAAPVVPKEEPKPKAEELRKLFRVV